MVHTAAAGRVGIPVAVGVHEAVMEVAVTETLDASAVARQLGEVVRVVRDVAVQLGGDRR